MIKFQRMLFNNKFLKLKVFWIMNKMLRNWQNKEKQLNNFHQKKREWAKLRIICKILIIISKSITNKKTKRLLTKLNQKL
ncbi:MAG: hypothetical protein E7062_05535 [Spirochaetaceae bacterium]|nr:hypothetical protein [Spirochaetaceae bacterium]